MDNILKFPVVDYQKEFGEAKSNFIQNLVPEFIESLGELNNNPEFLKSIDIVKNSFQAGLITTAKDLSDLVDLLESRKELHEALIEAELLVSACSVTCDGLDGSQGVLTQSQYRDVSSGTITLMAVALNKAYEYISEISSSRFALFLRHE